MAGGGNYPVMSDLEWANAPWNEPDVRYCTCPYCEGTGEIWLGEELVECDQCNGTGEIEY